MKQRTCFRRGGRCQRSLWRQEATGRARRGKGSPWRRRPRHWQSRISLTPSPYRPSCIGAVSNTSKLFKSSFEELFFGHGSNNKLILIVTHKEAKWIDAVAHKNKRSSGFYFLPKPFYILSFKKCWELSTYSCACGVLHKQNVFHQYNMPSALIRPWC